MSSPRAKQGIDNIKAHMLDDEASDSVPVSTALNSNECALGPSPLAVAAARAASVGLERYFEQPRAVLAPAIAERFSLDPARITIGQGSDDLLARLARAYLEPGTELLRSANGYLKAPNYAYANDARPVAAADENFSASVDGLLGAVTRRTRIVYLANPDNPTGTFLGGAALRRLHAGLPDHVLLILDCAYEEYVDTPDYEPSHRLVDDTDNVVVTRTFSKIFGLAGARVGWLYGPPATVDAVERIGLTFPLSTPSVAACLAALQDRAHTRRVYDSNIRLRNELHRSLRALGLNVSASQTNFLLVGFPDPDRSARAACASLRRRGIAVRRFAAPAFRNFIRITLGLESEIRAVEQAIAGFMRGQD